MIARLGMFIAKSFPKVMGTMISPSKNKGKLFKNAANKLKKSKTYKLAENFLDEDPGQWAKRNLKSSLENGGLFEVIKGVSSGLSSSIGNFTPSPRPSPPTSVPKTSSGGVVPGAKNISLSMQESAKAYNSSIRNIAKLQSQAQAASMKSKKVLDNYRASFTKKNATLGELMQLNADMRKSIDSSKNYLGKNLSIPPERNVLKRITKEFRVRSGEGMKETSSKELSNYIQSALNSTVHETSKNIDVVNQNLEKVMTSLAKIQGESAKNLAINLGNFTAQNIQELSRVITKSEQASFQKQQDIGYYQTEVLSRKMDESHNYNTASLNAIRNDILNNTQSMYSLAQDSRRIDAEYRDYEERKNAGISMPKLYGLTKQVAEMVQMTFKSQNEFDSSAKSAMRSMIGDFSYELGYMAQMLKEGVTVLNSKICDLMKGIDEKVTGPENAWFLKPLKVILGFAGKGINLVDKHVLTNLLGLKETVTGDVFNLDGGQDCFGNDFSNKTEVLKDEINQKSSGGLGHFNDRGYYVDPQTGKKYGVNKDFYHIEGGVNFNGNSSTYESLGNNIYSVKTLSGHTTNVKVDRSVNDTEYSFKRKIINAAYSDEADDLLSQTFFRKDETYLDKEEAKERYIQNMKAIELSYVEYDFTNDKYFLTGFPSDKRDSKGYAVLEENVSGKIPNKNEAIKPYSKKIKKGNNINYRFEIDHTLNKYLSLAFKEAMQKGLPVFVTSTLRVIPSGRKFSSSNHFSGRAVDVSLKGFNEASSAVLAGKYKPTKIATSHSVIITRGEVSRAAEKGVDINGNSIDGKYQNIMKKFMEWVYICDKYGLSVGIQNAPDYWKARGNMGKNNELIDLVHIQVSNKKSVISYEDAAKYNENLDYSYIDKTSTEIEKDSLNDKISGDINSALNIITKQKETNTNVVKNLFGLGYKYKIDGFGEDLFGGDFGRFTIKDEEGSKEVYLRMNKNEVLDNQGNFKVLTDDEIKKRDYVIDNFSNYIDQNKDKVKGLGLLKNDDIRNLVTIMNGYYGEEIENKFKPLIESLYSSLSEKIDAYGMESLQNNEKVIYMQLNSARNNYTKSNNIPYQDIHLPNSDLN